MATVTVYDIMTSMSNRLAANDPTMSTALGTPQRKIMDAVANEIYNYVQDTTVDSTLMSIDSYTGSDLDMFVAMFGLTRQQAKSATGYVTVKRDSGDSATAFAYGSQFYKPTDATSSAVYFQSTSYALLSAGVLSIDIPVIATTSGVSGNVNANTITASSATGNYYSVTNPAATSGGQDAETDAALRTRFLDTLFRNVSGTKDQYLALVLANAYTSRANLIGLSSTWTEIGTVGDDFTVASDNDEWSSILNTDKRLWVYDADTSDMYTNGTDYTVTTNDGTTAPVITFRTHDIAATNGEYLTFDSKKAYTEHLNVVANSIIECTVSTAAATVAKVPDAIVTVNDYSVVKAVFSNGSTSSTMTLNVTCDGTAADVACNFPSVVSTVSTDEELYFVYYDEVLYNIKYAQIYSPSVSVMLSSVRQPPWYYDFNPVTGLLTTDSYWSATGTIDTTSKNYMVLYSYSALNKGDFVKIEYDYVSSINRGGTKTVDLYVDGENYISVSDLSYFNSAYKMNTFQDVSEYQRDDGSTPLAANYFVPLSYQPIYHSNGIDMPNSVNYGTGLTLTEGADFWYVHDISKLRGSTQGQDGIEIKASIVDTDKKIADGYPLNIPYLYNNVPYVCQELVAEQTTVATDVLVHEAKRRFFTICVTIMYSSYPRATVEGRVKTALTNWVNSLSYGSWVQMSDIQNVVASVTGVDNARIAKSTDSINDYGIIEYYSDGETRVSNKPLTDDFRLKQNEIAALQDVIIYSRTQGRW